jgi:hypothetical protein
VWIKLNKGEPAFWMTERDFFTGNGVHEAEERGAVPARAARVTRGLKGWKFGGEAAGLSVDAQQFAFDHMAKKLARHVDRKCTVIRFPSEKVPAALIPYLALDETRPEAINALINQARTDADMTNSKCTYADTDPEAALICALFASAPARTTPLASRNRLYETASRDAILKGKERPEHV